jgi:hypothetical protein
MAMSDRKPHALWQKKWKPNSSDDKGTVVASSSQKVKVSAVALNLQPLIPELEPMDTTSTGKACAAEVVVDTTNQILFKVDLDQCIFDLYLSSERGSGKKGIWVVIGIKWWKCSVFLFVSNYHQYFTTIIYVVTKPDKIIKG